MKIKCIGCGECVINCPMSAWTRSPKKYYKLMIMGRTGKQNPRLAEDWLRWVDEDSIVKLQKIHINMLKNLYLKMLQMVRNMWIYS